MAARPTRGAIVNIISRLAALIAITAGSVIASPAIADADDVGATRVLVVGDSVTHGQDGDHTWRYFAWHRLAAGSVDFVGPHRGTHLDSDTWGGSYADPDFDQDHAARWGQAMWQPLDHPDDRSPAIGDLIASHDPDIIVEALGVNDLAWAKMSAEKLSEQVRRFVAQARAAKSDVDVVLGGVPQIWIGDAPAFNAALPSLAAELSTSASRVVVAEVPAFVVDVDTRDLAHPSRGGEERLGASYAAAIDSLLPAAPTPLAAAPTAGLESESESTVPSTEPAPVVTSPVIQQPVPGPSTEPRRLVRPRGVKAVRNGSKVSVSWKAVRSADAYQVQCGSAVKSSKRPSARMRTRASRCRVRALAGSARSPWSTVRVR